MLSSPGWTGGQLALARGLLALYLALRVPAASLPAALLLWALAAAFALGWWMRASAAALAVLGWACSAGVAGADAGLRLGLLMTALLACVPPAPWGSLDRRGAPDPGTEWRMPGWVPAWMWILASVLFLIDLGQGRWPLGWPHLLLLTPGWIPPLAPAALDRVFYDGSCALCHGTVRFLIAEDPDARRFRYAPLDSEALRARVDAATRASLPDSVVILTGDDELLVRSDAALHMLARIGGWWRALAWLGERVPRALRDPLYDAIARTRYSVFGTKDETCPLLPPGLRERFDP